MKHWFITKFWRILPYDRECKRELNQERERFKHPPQNDTIHLSESLKWICRAQDSSVDDGVARAFKTSIYNGYGPHGWQASYPETTGYIIPTFFAAAEVLKENAFKQRAIRMADWEISIQLSSGAVMGSVVTARPSPAVFNTGQVILGWVTAFKNTQNIKYLNAATRAADYLLSVQEPDGSWKKGNSQFALREATVYNTRVAWALIELGLLVEKSDYIEAGIQNVRLAISKQQDNGWFSDNCLDNPDFPLLHTIVYATRGILESGILLKENAFIDAANKTLAALQNVQRPDGGLPGRLGADWNGHTNWDCVTGNAQLAAAWLRADALRNQNVYSKAAREAIDFVKRTQNLSHANDGIRGGVKGSFPFDGDYGKFEMLNWAAKFFCDALMMITHRELAIKGIGG